MKHGVTTYSFASYLEDGRMTLTDCIKKAAEMGFDGIEMANLSSYPPYDVKELKETADAAHIEICSWATYADLCQNVQEQISQLKKEMDDACYLGCKIFRTDIYHEELSNPFNKEVIDALRDLASLAKEKGMVLTTENHGGPLATSDKLERLFHEVNHENFGLLCDFSNFEDAGEDPVHALSVLKNHVRHVHCKDAHLLSGERIFPGTGWWRTRDGRYLRCAITGQGNLPLYQLLSSLYENGYDGYLIQEFEGLEDCLYALEKGLAYTKRLIQLLPMAVWNKNM